MKDYSNDQEVVCIYKGPWKSVLFPALTVFYGPKYNEVCTVEGWFEFDGKIYLTLREYPFDHIRKLQPAYNANHFAQLITDSELHDAINKISEPQTA